MPYKMEGNCVKKEDGSEVPGGCHKTHEEAVAHLRALEANVKNSGVVEMSMRITKASYNKSDDTPRHWAAVDSDTDSDLYQEKMSVELYKDFVSRIENNTPVPEPFKSLICEDEVWCGGMPYLSIAHYKAGSNGANLPGTVSSVYIDGTRLKSKGVLSDTNLGRKVFDALCDDYKMKSNVDHRPVRISIGFIDLEHKHLSEVGGQEFTFTRTDVGQLCPMCVQGIGGKVYTKGQLIHLAMTRVPVNPRTEMSVEKSMNDEIKTKRDDAASIVGELADGLEEKSIASDILVVRSDGSMPTVDPSELTPCYNPNDGGWNQECINSVMNKYMVSWRDSIGTATVKSETMPKALLDAVQKSITELYKSNGYEPVVEDAMSEKVEKMVAGGVSIPEKKFDFAGLDGSGNNTIPNPVKADTKEADEPADEEKKEAVKEMSTMDKSYEQLKSALASAKSVDEVQAAFNSLGQEVEKSFTPPAPTVENIAEIVRSAVEAAVAPLKVEIATLRSQPQNTVSNGQVVKSKALNIGSFTTPEQMIQKAVTNAPARKLTQIEAIARKSTGLQS